MTTGKHAKAAVEYVAVNEVSATSMNLQQLADLLDTVKYRAALRAREAENFDQMYGWLEPVAYEQRRLERCIRTTYSALDKCLDAMTGENNSIR